jgi:hypothetical protein
MSSARLGLLGAVLVGLIGCARGAGPVESPGEGRTQTVRVPDLARHPDTARDEPRASDEAVEPYVEAPRSPPPSSDAKTCTVRVQVQDAGSYAGRGKSTVTAEHANKKAWEEACRAVLDATGIDCHDTTRVRVTSISSSTQLVVTPTGAEKEYEHAIEVVTFREATGSSSAGGNHQETCLLAIDEACRAAIGQVCPASGVRLVEIDGAPTFDESWLPSRSPDAPDRITI